MLEAFTLAAHFVTPASPEWSVKKRMLRERLVEVVAAGNDLHTRNDTPPRLTMARLHDQHGEYSHDWDIITLDLESVHDPEKFWHVYNETVAHEWAHKLNASVNDSSGHGDDFERVFGALRQALRVAPEENLH